MHLFQVYSFMAILKLDGTTYTTQGKAGLDTYRPNGQDVKQLDKWDQEALRIGGSPCIYYPCLIDTNFDEVYMESRNSIITQEGIEVILQFLPVRPAQDWSSFGIDSPDELFFNANFTEWMEKVGEFPKLKSLILLLIILCVPNCHIA